MQDWAASFLAIQARVGLPLTGAADDVDHLDELVDDFVRTEPSAAAQQNLIMSVGAYLGELLVLHGDGRWSYDRGHGSPAVQLPNGAVAYPHGEVAQRIRTGENGLADYYRATLPPGEL